MAEHELIASHVLINNDVLIENDSARPTPVPTGDNPCYRYHGITLIELIVVVVVISVIAAIGARSVTQQPQFFSHIAKADVMNFQLAIQSAIASATNPECQTDCFDSNQVNGRWQPLPSFDSPTSPSASAKQARYHLYAVTSSMTSVIPNCDIDITGEWRWMTMAIPTSNNAGDTTNALYYYDTGVGFTDLDGNAQCGGDELW